MNSLIRHKSGLLLGRRGAMGLFVLLFLVGVVCPCLAVEYKEAPVLSKLVEAGKLPPVEQRLPEEPLIVDCVERIGEYGGELRTVRIRPNTMEEVLFMTVEPLLRFAKDGKTVVPNVAKRWEFSNDGKSLTVWLRKGIRWSDGVEVTVDDVLFAYYDVILNEKIIPVVPPEMFLSGGKPVQIERIDDYTFRINASKPIGAMLYFLTQTVRDGSLLMPKHYLKQYHSKYAPAEKLKAMAKKEGYNHWYELFFEHNFTVLGSRTNCPADYPTLGPWKALASPAIGYTILERNPYCWKVDRQGNQLPYIDRIQSLFVASPETLVLKVISGELDFAGNCGGLALADIPIFLKSAQKGNYSVYFWEANHGSKVTYHLNQNVQDLELRKIFRDKRFRQALSLAINREELNKVLYYGKFYPQQLTVNRHCSYYVPEYEQAYAQYDPGEANRLLDEMGLKRDKPSGLRRRPDGKTVRILLEIIGRYFSTIAEAELVVEYWRDVGIDVHFRTIAGELKVSKFLGNSLDIMRGPDDCATDMMFLNNMVYALNEWGQMWYKWFRTNGKQGEEPPEEIKKYYRIWERMRETPDEQERIALGKSLVKWQAENLWGIGTVGRSFRPQIVNKRLHNVPREGLDGWAWLATFLHHPEQFFLSQEAQ